MARRKGGGDGGGVLILVGIAIVAILAVLYVALLGALLLYPIAALILFVTLLDVSALPPELPEAEAYDDAARTRLIRQLLAHRNRLALIYQALEAQGLRAGIHLTRGSDERRFDSRSSLGRRINSGLDSSEAELSEVIGKIAQVRSEVSLPPWQEARSQWEKMFALKLAYRCALIALPVGCAVFYLWYQFDPEPFRSVQQTLLSKDFASGPPLVPLGASVLLSYATFGIAWRLSRDQLRVRNAGPRASALLNLAAKWSPHTNVDHHFSPDPAFTVDEQPDFEQPTNNRHEGRNGGAQSWCDVLGVGRSASQDEIKAAYREKIKEYHSDRVATLGQKLRDLAEEESKMINAAYDAAKRERGFK